MMAEIKAIETFYNGYKFRSRLEARWAVYFDKMGVSYEYEPEGYSFPDGSAYLPDFYLPKLDAYVEIKHSEYFHFNQNGNEFEFWCDDKKQSYKYANAINNLVDDEHIFLLLCGDPYDVLDNAYHGKTKKNGKGVVFHMDYCLNQELIRHKKLKPEEVKCDSGKCKGLRCKPKLFSCNDIYGFTDDGKIIVAVRVEDCRIPKPLPCFEIFGLETEFHRSNVDLRKNFENAEKARQARFEHGECG